MEQEPGKNKGGRPKTKTILYNRKVTFYLSDEEYGELDEFLVDGWRDQNCSAAARFLLLRSLRQWQKKGKKPVSLRGEF
jgi:hypothetical protein